MPNAILEVEPRVVRIEFLYKLDLRLPIYFRQLQQLTARQTKAIYTRSRFLMRFVLFHDPYHDTDKV